MSKFEVENRFGELIIRWRHRPKVRWFLLFFSLIWNGILLIFFFAMSGSGTLPWFLSLHLIAGLGILYLTLVQFVNKREIRAGKGGLIIEGGPIPVLGQNQSYSYEKVDQLYVKHSGSTTTNGRTTQYYGLALRTKDGKDKMLAGWLKQAQALELERRIEDHLGIEDQPIELNSSAVEMLRKWKPEWAEMVEEAHQKQQGKLRTSHALPRRVPGPERDYAPQLQHAEPGYIINLRGNNLAMTEGRQIDWERPGFSDRLLSVYDATAGENYYLYCEQNGENWQYFEERSLSPEEQTKIGWIVAKGLPQQLKNGDEIFHLREERRGNQFSMPGPRIEEVKQRIYQHSATKTRFRVIWTVGKSDYKVSIQEIIKTSEIGDVLAG